MMNNSSDKAPEHLDKYDLCLVFPFEQKSSSLSALRAEVVEKIAELVGEDYVFMCRDHRRRKVFMYIRASMRLVKRRAESDKLQLLLDAEKTRLLALEGSDDASIDGFDIHHMKEVTRLEPFDFIYGDYVARREVQHLYHCSSGMQHPFRKSIRVKLLASALQSSSNSTCQLSLEYLHLGKIIDCFYPVHDGKALRAFASDWVCPWLFPWTQPYDNVKDYFGEKIAFYFIFLGFLSYWLVVPALIGVGLQVLMMLHVSKGNPESPCFAGLSALWVCTAVRYWSKVEQVTAMKWNMTGVSHRRTVADPARYSFHGRDIQSYIDGGYMLYFSSSRRKCLYVFSTVCCAVLLVFCLATVAALFYLRSIIRDGFIAGRSIGEYEDWLTAAACSLQITVANQLIHLVSVALTDTENHRSDPDFDSAVVMKIAVLQSINAFSSFLYIAFGADQTPRTYPSAALSAVPLRESVNGCGRFALCFDTLGVHLLVVVGTQAVGAMLVNIVLPLLYEYTRKELLPIVDDCFYTCFCAAADRTHDATYDPIDFDACQYNPFAYNTCSCCVCCDVELMEDDDPAADRTDSIDGGNNIPDTYRDRDIFFGVNPTGRMRSHDKLRGSATTPPDNNIMRRNSSSDGRSVDRGDDEQGESDDGNSDVELSDNNRYYNNLAITPTQSRNAALLSRRLQGDTGSEAKSDEVTRHRPPLLVPRNTRRVGSPSEGVDSEDSATADDDVQSSQPGRSEEDELDDDDDGFDEQFDMASRRGHYDQVHRLRSNYSRVTLMLHLVTCFGSALPGCFLIMFLYVYFEIKSGARKLSYVNLRPFPVEDEGIMAWRHVLHAFVYVSVLINAALISFSMQQFAHWQLQFKLCLFLAVCALCVAYRCVLRLTMSDIPPEVSIQQMRTKVINSKLILQVPDRTSNSRAVDLL